MYFERGALRIRYQLFRDDWSLRGWHSLAGQQYLGERSYGAGGGGRGTFIVHMN